MTFTTAVPEDESLAMLGRTVYTWANLEWTITDVVRDLSDTTR